MDETDPNYCACEAAGGDRCNPFAEHTDQCYPCSHRTAARRQEKWKRMAEFMNQGKPPAEAAKLAGIGTRGIDF